MGQCGRSDGPSWNIFLLKADLIVVDGYFFSYMGVTLANGSFEARGRQVYDRQQETLHSMNSVHCRYK